MHLSWFLRYERSLCLPFGFSNQFLLFHTPLILPDDKIRGVLVANPDILFLVGQIKIWYPLNLTEAFQKQSFSHPKRQKDFSLPLILLYQTFHSGKMETVFPYEHTQDQLGEH